MSHPQTTEIADNDAEQQRLHTLFNRWVPNYERFRHVFRDLRLSEADYKAIKHEFMEYSSKVAQARASQETYTAPWETFALLKQAITASNVQLTETIQDRKDAVDTYLHSGMQLSAERAEVGNNLIEMGTRAATRADHRRQ